MTDRFRPQYRPVDPRAMADAVAGMPRLLVIEVIAAEGAEGARYGCRVVDVVAGTEVTRHSGDADDIGTGELLAVAWGLRAVADEAPDARIVVQATGDLVERLGVQELTDPEAVLAVAMQA